jgi:hypothetical protein
MQPPRATQRIDRPTQDRWQLGDDVEGVRFKMLDYVAVASGPFAGFRGELISIIALVPEPEFHLETSDGGDCYVLQSELVPAVA